MTVINSFCMKGTNVIFATNKFCQLAVRSYCTSAEPSAEYKKWVHPYKQLHPWKSRDKFFQHLLANVIYNKDGLVALNKPYGIPSSSAADRDRKNILHQTNYVANGADYSLSESLPFLAKNLGYSELTVVQTPEKYNSGVTLLAENEKVQKRVLKSRVVAATNKTPRMIYWIVTTKLPREVRGTKYVGITFTEMKNVKKPVIIHTWPKAAMKSKKVVPIRAEFQLLSNSTGNLGSLIELKISSQKWHAVRLFAATELYSPILGDNVHGARLQHILQTWVVANPFSATVEQGPVLHKDLKTLLNLENSNQAIIPAHIHLKQVLLPMFSNKEDLRIEAPLPPYFAWTCKKLQFEIDVPPHKETLHTAYKSNEVRYVI